MSPAGRVAGPARDLFLAMNGVALRAAPAGDAVAAPPAWDRLDEIAVPTLILCGDLDFPHLQDRCAHIARTIPEAENRSLAGVAHLPSLERPDEITAILKAFLAAL
jgi:pimeloyl-ACP methyl ester carboxylesterase